MRSQVLYIHLALCTALVLLTSCGGGGPNQPTAIPAREWQDEVRRQVADLVETYGPLGFEVVLPDYLPAGLDPDPEVHVITPDALNPAVLVSFSAKDEDDGQLLLLDIISEPLAFIDCPLCPDEGQTSTTVHGGPAVAEEGQFLTGDDSVGYGLTFAVGEVLVQLTADWFVKDPNVTTPTAEMKDELLRIAESMFPSPE